MDFPVLTGATEVKPRHISELVEQYRASSWWTKLAARTRKDYDEYINMLLNSNYSGAYIDTFTPKLADMIYQHIKTEHGIKRANYFTTVWVRIYNFAIKNEWIAVNPWEFTERSKTTPRDTVWTEQQVKDVINAAKVEGNKEFATYVKLLYEVGQRPSDVLSMNRSMLIQDEHGWYIKFRQKKTGAFVTPAISNETHCMINELTDIDLDGSFFKSFTLENMQEYLRHYKDLLKLPKELQLRDLRRTALTEAGSAGATDAEMKAQSGHKNRAMLDTYSVSTRKQSLEGFRKRFKDA